MTASSDCLDALASVLASMTPQAPRHAVQALVAACPHLDPSTNALLIDDSRAKNILALAKFVRESKGQHRDELLPLLFDYYERLPNLKCPKDIISKAEDFVLQFTTHILQVAVVVPEVARDVAGVIVSTAKALSPLLTLEVLRSRSRTAGPCYLGILRAFARFEVQAIQDTRLSLEMLAVVQDVYSRYKDDIEQAAVLARLCRASLAALGTLIRHPDIGRDVTRMSDIYEMASGLVPASGTLPISVLQNPVNASQQVLGILAGLKLAIACAENNSEFHSQTLEYLLAIMNSVGDSNGHSVLRVAMLTKSNDYIEELFRSLASLGTRVRSLKSRVVISFTAFLLPTGMSDAHVAVFHTFRGSAMSSLLDVFTATMDQPGGMQSVRGLVHKFVAALSDVEQLPQTSRLKAAVSSSVVIGLGQIAERLNRADVTSIILPVFVEKCNQISMRPEARNPNHSALPDARLSVTPLLIENLAKIAILSRPNIDRDVVQILSRLHRASITGKGPVSPGLVPAALQRIAQSFHSVPADEWDDAFLFDILRIFVTTGKEIMEQVSSSQTAQLSSMAGYLGVLLPAIGELAAARPRSFTEDPPQDRGHALLRSAWLYCVVFGFVKNEFWLDEWYHSVCKLAACMPTLMVPGEHSDIKISYEYSSLLFTNPKDPVKTQEVRAMLVHLLPGSLSTISKLTYLHSYYLLCIYHLETMRATTSRTFAPMFLYLADSCLSQSDISPCIRAIADKTFAAFEVATAPDNGEASSQIVSGAAKFLLVQFSHQYHRVRSAADKYLTTLIDRFPAVLWNQGCLHIVLDLLNVLGDAKSMAGSSQGVQYSVEIPSTHDRVVLPDSHSERMTIRENVHDLSQQWLDKAFAKAPRDTSLLLQSYLRLFSEASRGCDREHAGYSHGVALGVRTGSAVDEDKRSGKGNGLGAQHGTAAASFVNTLDLRARCSGMLAGIREVHASLDSGLEFTEFMTKNIRSGFEAFSSGGIPEVSDAQLHKLISLLHRTVAFLVENPLCARPDIVRYLVQVPICYYSSAAVETGIFCWAWLLSCVPVIRPLVMKEIARAWSWTINHNIGLFFSDYADDRSSLLPGPPRPVELARKTHTDATPHGLLLDFLSEQLEILQPHEHALSNVMRMMIHQALDDVDATSALPANILPRFKLIRLGLQLLGYRGGDESAETSLLRQQVYKCGLTWFTHVPAHHTDAETIVPLLIAVCKLVDLDKSSCVIEGDSLPEVSLPPPSTPVRSTQSRTNVNGTSSPQRTPTSSSDRLPSPMVSSKRSVSGIGDDVVATANSMPSAATSSSTATDKGSSVAELNMGTCNELLIMLLSHEIERICVWANPLSDPSLTIPGERQFSAEKSVSPTRWASFVKQAWQVKPALAIALASRFQYPGVIASVERLVASSPETVIDCPEAVPFLVSDGALVGNAPSLNLLAYWAPCRLLEALSLMTSRYRGHHLVYEYAVRSLRDCDDEDLVLYLPQLVQCLRRDSTGALEMLIVEKAQAWSYFALQVIYILRTLGADDADVRKLGASADPLLSTAMRLRVAVIGSLADADRLSLQAELEFFDEITEIAGTLKPLPPQDRKPSIIKQLKKIPVKNKLYLPTNPNAEVQDVIYDRSAVMASHARTPIMVHFEVSHTNDNDYKLSTRTPASPPKQTASGATRHPDETTTDSCIFKVGDDCRQDVLALQLIELFKQTFHSAGDELYVHPYKILSTNPGCGIIHVIPNSKSRDQLGKTTDGSLYDYFLQQYGHHETEAFQHARANFIRSAAGVAVSSFLLQIKDRHNGNILFDSDGHTIHIDFGFMFEIAPGGKMSIERAPFKLNREMIQLMGGGLDSEHFQWFMALCVRGYLASRQYRQLFGTLVELMTETDLPCFTKNSVRNLAFRFNADKTDACSERAAAVYMKGKVMESFDKYATYAYDHFQYLQNGYSYSR